MFQSYSLEINLNNRITHEKISNTNRALLTKPSHTVSYKPAANQTGRINNGKDATYQHQNSNQHPKNLYPPGKALLLGEGGTNRATTGTGKTSTRTEKSEVRQISMLGI